MLKAISLSAACSVALLALISGCSNLSQAGSTQNATLEQAVVPNPSEQAGNPAKPPIQVSRVLTAAPDNPDPTVNAAIQLYVNQLASQGFAQANQGVWMQSGDTLLANHQGTIPLPAASITKVATSLAALSTYGPDHQFKTQFIATGPVENGVLEGDLVVVGGQDPFFVWEEAIAVGNTLNQMGIRQVTGNLVIAGPFYMNFETLPQAAGQFLYTALDSQLWSGEVEDQYRTLPSGTPRPQVRIQGSVQVVSTPPNNLQPIVNHYSYPVAELLKKMNQYSNNLMADMLADTVGGARVVAQKAAQAAGVPQAEIQLINGSGLGVENRISPRAAVAMFRATEQLLQPHQMTVADIFTVVGRDAGILETRQLPSLAVVKSGTLNEVSSLAGAIPTQQQGTIWFAIMNGGTDIEGFRLEQEDLLRSFLQQWGTLAVSPQELLPNPQRQSKRSYSELVK
ncbi:MAG: D-alanyl-D-alanine carboxypeptidase [Desertifilum sp.]|nr:D-alanyl-D-alanine carboxypeptidase [Desertifilum sp.]